MKKVTVLLILFFITLSSSLFAQDTTNFQLIKNIATQADFFTTDNQSNIYAVKANVLTKFDKKGKLLYKYSNKNFGDISFVDASNMMKILLFYKSYLVAVFLDNTLSQNGDPISFDKLGFIQTQLVCSSNNSSMWIYDQQNLQLIRLDQNLVPTQKTGNLSVLLNMSLQPDALIEYDNKVYLNNPGSGILIFDIYGTYYKTIPVKDVKQFQPFNGRVFYTKGTDIKAYDLKTADEFEYQAPVNKFKNFRLEMGVLVVQNDSIIQLFAPKTE